MKMSFLLMIKMWVLVFIFMFVLNSETWVARGQPQVPCYFIFGDSLADPGNNNMLLTLAKANYPPYGVDFFTGVATGRFTNGQTYVDILAQLLALDDFIPGFAVNASDILKGLNYASGAAGILDDSGRMQGDRFTMNRQVFSHAITVARLQLLLKGRNNTMTYLNKCLYTVGIGSNDYINNYFMPQYYPSSRLFNPYQFASLLARQLSQQLQLLYNDGARKVVVIGLGQIGFTPYEIAAHGSGNPPTVFDINNAVELFNIKLRSLVDDFNTNQAGAKFTFINITAIAASGNPSRFASVTTSCCIVGSNNMTCVPNSIPCPDRTEYAFFDNIHPAEAVNAFLAEASYTASSPSFVHPYDISTLVKL